MRVEKDSMGEMQVPDRALYGASTQRAVLNFPISGRRMQNTFIQGLGLVKWACASANQDLGRLSQEKADIIRAVAKEVHQGELCDHFPVDIFQTGSGTSSNMNVNEVIANRASEISGKPIGSKDPIHPNDDVNLGQSSNDIIPTVLHVSIAVAIQDTLIPSLEHLGQALTKNSEAFHEAAKVGDSGFTDDVAEKRCNEFGGYAAQVFKGVERARRCVRSLSGLAIGGTAVGTGINCHPDFPGIVCRILAEKTGIPFRVAENHFEAQAARDDAVEVAGYLVTIACSLSKLAHDFKIPGGGPRLGFGAINRESLPPDSSPMPGGVNQTLCEMLSQVCFYSSGLCNTVAMCGRDGHFELNVTIPLISHCLGQSITTLAHGARIFTDQCIERISVKPEKCDEDTPLTNRKNRGLDVSGYPLPEGLIQGLGLIKWAYATANEKSGYLTGEKAELIRQVSMEIYEGKITLEEFPIDVFLSESGVAANTWVNQAIVRWASQRKQSPSGSKVALSLQDEINLGQLPNDLIPVALHVSLALAIKNNLIPALSHLGDALEAKTIEYDSIVKIGRTHLMDATPLTLGQEFSGYTAQVRKGIERAEQCIVALQELPIGGTTAETESNSKSSLSSQVCSQISEKTKIPFREAKNLFEEQSARDDAVEVAGLLSTIAASLTKIANDIRMLGSGPRAGIGEINLPSTQPGSSIMPGKVNPVMSEMMVQVCLYVQGLSNMVAMCGRNGCRDLNPNVALIAFGLEESVDCLANAARTFADRCVSGIEANVDRCRELVDSSLMLVTALNPYIGYDQAAAVAKKAYAENKTLREVILENNLLDEETLTRALDPMTMVKPQD